MARKYIYSIRRNGLGTKGHWTWQLMSRDVAKKLLCIPESSTCWFKHDLLNVLYFGMPWFIFIDNWRQGHEKSNTIVDLIFGKQKDGLLWAMYFSTHNNISVDVFTELWRFPKAQNMRNSFRWLYSDVSELQIHSIWYKSVADYNKHWREDWEIN